MNDKPETLVEEKDGEKEANTAEGAVEETEEAKTKGEAESTEKLGELEKLEKELEEVQAQASEYLDGWQRSQAEFSNYKKRQNMDRARMRTLASANLLRKLLPVVDDFERALSTLPDNLGQVTWCEGLFLIKQKLNAILETEGVEPIETEGQEFDPRYHEAVTHEEAPGYEENQIIGEVQKGYILGERVLRPSLVRVAKALDVQPDESEDNENDEGDETTENKE